MKPIKILTISLTWAVMLAAVMYINFAPDITPVQIKEAFIYFPFEIDGWKDKEKVASDYLITALGADDLLLREYENSYGDKLELYLAYFRYTKDNKGPHAPQLCWVGAGWALKSLGDEELALHGAARPKATIRKTLAEKEGQKIILLYCYKINDTYVTDFFKFRAISILDSIFKRKNSAFTLQLSAPVGDEDPDKKEARMKDFLVKALSILEADYLP